MIIALMAGITLTYMGQSHYAFGKAFQHTHIQQFGLLEMLIGALFMAAPLIQPPRWL
jgi:hypothetical protein